jgi:hypothetical protein
MGRVLDKLTGRTGKIFPEWEAAVCDARCRFRDIAFDEGESRLSIRCWRPVTEAIGAASFWEELLVTFESLPSPPIIEQTEVLPYYELATVSFDPAAQRIVISFHAALSISFPATSPNFSFHGPTGRRLEWSQILNETRAT